MRYLAPLLAVALTACLDDLVVPPSRDDTGTEVPRGTYQYLVERQELAGRRGYYTMAIDGTMVGEFPVPEGARNLVPSPDGRTIAYLLDTKTGVHLWVMDREGGNRHAVVEGDRAIESVSWSPDGARLAFDGSAPGSNDDIWLVNVNGGGLQQLTVDPSPATFVDRKPVWSPDGTRIAFLSDRGGSLRLWVVNINGTSPTQLVTAANQREVDVAWWPGGTNVAFLASTTTGRIIGTVAPDGSQYKSWPVDASATNISRAPDGNVLYSASSSGNAEVFVLDMQSGASTNLTKHPERDVGAVALKWVEPTWRGFAAAASLTTNRPNPAGIGVGDFDGDGRMDALLLAPAASEVRYFRGTATGIAPVGALTAPSDQRDVAVLDFNGDGYDDFVVLGGSAISVWKGSAGGPGVATTLPFAGDGRGLAVGDFDSNGKPDVAVIHQEATGGFGMLVHGANGNGDLIAILDYHATFSGGGRACAGDVNRDAHLDVVVATSVAASSLVIVPGQGDITFGAARVGSTAVGPDETAIVACADFDGDRRADVAYLRPDRANGLSVLRTSAAAFGTPTPFAVRGGSLATTDMDRDGDVDVLVSSATDRSITIVRNRGDGTFAPPETGTVGGTPLHILAADMNADGWNDLVAVETDGTLTVRLNRGR